MPKDESSGAGRVPSIASAIRILRYLAANPHGNGVNAIARSTHLSPSSCFNLLKALAAEDFVDFDPVTKVYVLGVGPIALARGALNADGAFAALLPAMERLADRFRLTSALWRLNRNERLMLLGVAESASATRIQMSVGQRLPMLVGAMGRCVAARAQLQDDEIADRFAALRWETPITLRTYLAQVATARDNGWAIDQDGFMRGVTTLAAPIVDGEGAVRFCIANTLFTGQVSSDQLEEIGHETRNFALHASDRLFASVAPGGPPAAGTATSPPPRR